MESAPLFERSMHEPRLAEIRHSCPALCRNQIVNVFVTCQGSPKRAGLLFLLHLQPRQPLKRLQSCSSTSPSPLRPQTQKET
jgi:hypothetical protein